MTQPQYTEENFTIKIVDDLILSISIHDFKELTKDDIISMQDWVRSISERRDYVNLIQFGNGSSATREAREFAASSNGNTLTQGSALLVRNLAQQLIIDYYIKFNHPLKPTKSFYKREKALEWIHSTFTSPPSEEN